MLKKKKLTFPSQKKYSHNLIQFVHTFWINNISLHIRVHTERILYLLLILLPFILAMSKCYLARH